MPKQKTKYVAGVCDFEMTIFETRDDLESWIKETLEFSGYGPEDIIIYTLGNTVRLETELNVNLVVEV